MISIILTTWLFFVGNHVRSLAVPLLAANLGVGRSEVGWFSTAFALSAAAASLPLGRVSDLWGRRRVILLMILGGGMASFLMAGASTVAWLFVFMALSGLATGGFLPTAMALTGDTVPEHRRGQGYAWLTLSAHAGLTVGPIVGGILIQRAGFSPTFLVSAAAFAVAWIVAWSFITNAKGAELAERPSQETAPEGVRSPPPPRFSALLRNRRVIAAWLATMGLACGTGTVTGIFPFYAVETSYMPQTIGLIMGLYSASNALIRIPVGPLANDRNLRNKLIPTSLLGFALALALVPWQTSAVMLTVVLAGGAVAVGTAYVCLLTEISDATTPALRGVAMGGYSAVLYLGFAVGPPVAGIVSQYYGYLWGFGVVSLLVVAGAISTLLVQERV